jgi:hypothetical protein
MRQRRDCSDADSDYSAICLLQRGSNGLGNARN